MTQRPAKPTDWQTKPLPDQQAQISLDRDFSPDEIVRIQHGLIPEQMEDKWFIYWEDNQLFFHRSWTGYCVYIVEFATTDEGGTMIAARINRDPDQYRSPDNAYDAEMISCLIDARLLHRPASFPSTQDSTEN